MVRCRLSVGILPLRMLPTIEPNSMALVGARLLTTWHSLRHEETYSCAALFRGNNHDTDGNQHCRCADRQNDPLGSFGFRLHYQISE